eukprot:2687277-Amphidinium_carterae.1
MGVLVFKLHAAYSEKCFNGTASFVQEKSSALIPKSGRTREIAHMQDSPKRCIEWRSNED